MDLAKALKEVSELEERFLEADEMLDELPNPESPDEADEMSEAEHVLEAAMHSVESLHGLLTILKRPSHQGALLSLVGQEQMDGLNEAEACLEKLIELMSGVEQETDEEEAEAEEEPSEEEETEEPEAEEEEPAEEPEEEKEEEESDEEEEEEE